MNIKTFNKVLLPILECKITPWVWGLHAKGKSEVIEHFYRSRDWLVFNFRLNCMSDIGDMLGLQEFVTDFNGKKVATAFMMPEWLLKAIEFCKANPDKRACIFIDELNRAGTKDLIGPVFQMSLDRRLHTVVFPSNLDVIIATNPSTSDYSVLSLDDKALLSRFWHVDFNPSKEEWFEDSVEKEVDPDIIGFLEENPGFLEEEDLKKFSISDYAKPDRRKWRFADRLKKRNFLTDVERNEVIAGLVGYTAAVAFEGYLAKMDKPINLEEILNNYPAVRDRVLKAQKGRARTDILNLAVKKVKDHFSTDPIISDEEGANLIQFLKDLPNSQMFDAMHAIYKKRKFHDFCDVNYDKLKLIELENRLTEIRRTVLPETIKNV